jgi:hypothetical protein
MAHNLTPIRKSASEHVLAVVKAGLNAVPYVGSPIASLISDYVPSSTQRTVEKGLALLAEKLSSLEGRIDVEQVDKEEFAELFKSCYLVMVRSHHEEKLQAAALLANLLLRPGDPNKCSYEELDHFVRCLDALSIGAIAVLGAARHIAATAPSGGQGHFHFNQLSGTLTRFDPSLLMSLTSELRSLNLVRIQEGVLRMPDRSEILVEVTPIGRRFAERFIEGKM